MAESRFLPLEPPQRLPEWLLVVVVVVVVVTPIL